MSSSLCLRCLRLSLRSLEHPKPFSHVQRATFSTTSLLSAQPGDKKATSTARARKTLNLKKKKRQPVGKKPDVGERKAMRKRIVLSNVNAIQVQGLQDLTRDKLMRHSEGTLTLDQFQGKMLGLGNETVDALRALEAFKPTQGWSLFHRPATLVRKETAKLANELVDAENPGSPALRKIVFGNKSSGKSVLLLQAQTMAFLKGWVVVHFPEGQDLINAQTGYRPLRTPEGIVYIQPQYTAKLLLSIANANRAVLSRMQLSKQPQLPVPIQPNMSLDRFAELGGNDLDLAWPVWQALWAELTTPSQKDSHLTRPPVFVSMDGVDQIMGLSAYLDADAKPFHAHHLALVRSFTKLLSGQAALPNGGAVIAATCASNRVASPTLDYYLAHNHAEQQASAADKTDSSSVSFPQWQPYTPKDARVESALHGVTALKLQGMSREEARGVLEYYAQSGMLRSAVTDGLVSEKWTLAGSGNVGELERASVRI